MKLLRTNRKRRMQNAEYARKRYQSDPAHRKAQRARQSARRAKYRADPVHREIDRLGWLIDSRRKMIQDYRRKYKKASEELVSFTLSREKLLKVWEAQKGVQA